MNRLVTILFAAFLLGPQVRQVVECAVVAHREAADCCAPERGGERDCASCALCVCCATGVPALSSVRTVEVSKQPPARPILPTLAAPLSPPPAEILHVPKSA